ncbi:sulfite exporter TauE/SafE family protein [Orrella marina]|uniref:Probable membrane transporter protein n=1 Tax=Orrella marina TaxID=2163011 RepID=A0A2R4XMA0_9BURK|nr:sulfite exporter TauE/SafE family protein [Orrella marina]AWB34937.1 hypothetical protein DBV39_15735 [Orrella marina]
MNIDILFDVFRAQPDPLLCALLAAFSAFLMGFARSGIGAGGFVVSPLMVLALGPSVGIAVVAALMVPAAITGYLQHRKEADQTMLKPLIPAAFAGTALGGVILWLLVSGGEMAIIDRRLEILVAGLSLVYVALVSLRKQIASLGSHLDKPGPVGLFLMGTGLGLSQTVANSGSPLMTVYFLCYRIGKEKFVGAQTTFLMVQNTVKLVPLVLLGILHPGNATAALILLPLTFAGSWLGQRFYKHASEGAFFKLYIILLIIGFITSVLLLIGRDTVFKIT